MDSRQEATPLLPTKMLSDIEEKRTSVTSGSEVFDHEGANVKAESYDGWRAKLRDLSYRRKIIDSIWFCQCCLCWGLVISQLGLAFLDLQLVTHTNVQQASAFFTAASAGNMAGSLLCGLLYDRCSQPLLLLLLGMGMMGAMTAVLPFCSYLWLMATVSFLLTTFGMFINAVSNAGVMQVWGLQGEAVLQAIHFTYSLGGVVAPLITEPFFAPRHPQGNLSGPHCQTFPTNETQEQHNMTSGNGDTLPSSGNETTGLPYVTPAETQIHFAFVISSAITILSTMPLVADYVQQRRKQNRKIQNVTKRKSPIDQKKKEEQNKAAPVSSRLNLSRATTLVILVWVCVFYMLLMGVEITVPNYLTTFAVMQMNWSKSQGAVLTTVFWMAFAATRFACIFLVKVFTSLQMLLLCFGLMVPSFVGLLVSSMFQVDWGVWVSSAVAGASLSAVYASALSWTNSELLPVNGKVISAITMASNVGPMVNPMILGHLLETRGAIWMVYICLGETVACVLLFLLLVLFRRVTLQQSHCSPHQDPPPRGRDVSTSNDVGYRSLSLVSDTL